MFGHSIWSVKLFGLSELFMLMALMYIVLKKYSGERTFLWLCWAIFATDGLALSLGATDLRSDLLLTLLTLLVLFFAWGEGEGKKRFLIYAGGTLSILLLALTRITSAIPLVLLITCLATELCLSWKYMFPFKRGFYLSLIAVGVIGFVLRNQIFYSILPSSQDVPFYTYGLEGHVLGKIKNPDVLQMLEKEFTRWTRYFFLSNVGVLSAVALGLLMFGARIFLAPREQSKLQATSLAAGCAVAAGSLAAFDPVAWSTHAMPLVAVLILLLAEELGRIRNRKNARRMVIVLIGIVLVSSGMRTAHGAKVILMSVRNGYSNPALEQVINRVFPSDSKQYLVIGGSELWPYIHEKKNVILVDARTKGRIGGLADIVEGVDFVILNEDFAEYGWEKNFSEAYPNIKLKPIAQVGNPENGWKFIKILKPLVERKNAGTSSRAEGQPREPAEVRFPPFSVGGKWVEKGTCLDVSEWATEGRLGCGIQKILG